jgi:hypothetical protein
MTTEERRTSSITPLFRELAPAVFPVRKRWLAFSVVGVVFCFTMFFSLLSAAPPHTSPHHLQPLWFSICFWSVVVAFLLVMPCYVFWRVTFSITLDQEALTVCYLFGLVRKRTQYADIEVLALTTDAYGPVVLIQSRAHGRLRITTSSAALLPLLKAIELSGSQLHGGPDAAG